MSTPRSTAPATPVLAVSCRMLRSPSHESVTTDLSLFSISSLASETFGKHRILALKEQRGISPNPEIKIGNSRPADIPEVTWFEEGNDLIRSCAILSSVIGMQKSFSTSDIDQLPIPETQLNNLRQTTSDLALNSIQKYGYIMDHPRLDQTSRSCSTWVAVGELASQLPSPHGGPINSSILTSNLPLTPTFTAADLIRSVNKKVRQNYIRRRLLTTYRALERLSQSEFDLDRLEAAAVAATTASNCPGPTQLIVPTTIKISGTDITNIHKSNTDSSINIDDSKGNAIKSIQVTDVTEKCDQKKKKTLINTNKTLTIYDIERERGKPLSKYERNMMIFNWLHSLDDSPAEEDLS